MTTLNRTPVPFDDTFVLYDPHDPVSFVCAGLSLLPIAILVFYLSWFIITREFEPLVMAGGQVFNDVLNNVVKNYLKEPRPRHFEGFQENGLRSGYGMPSAHSQFMGFFFTYLTLRLWLQWRGLTKSHRIVGTVALGSISFAVIFARVYLSYHSWAQVIVGSTIGAACGATFFMVGTLARVMGAMDWFLNSKVSRLLWIKDSTFFEPLSLSEEHAQWLKRRGVKKA